MKALVTGGTGFVGSRLARALARGGWKIRCLVRESSDTSELKKLGAELRFGDLRDKPSLNGIAEEVDVVFHLAAIGDVNATSKRHLSQYRKVDVEGTRNLLGECVGRKIRKFVHFSSLAAMGEPKRRGIVSERDACRPRTPYEIAKRESELVVLEFWKRRGVPATILRPSMIYGEGRNDAGNIDASVRLRLVPIIGDGCNLIHMAHVDDVVDAAVLAAKHGKNGATYIISGASVTWNGLVDAIASKKHIRIRKVHVPLGLASPIVSIEEIVFSSFGLVPAFTAERLRRLKNRYTLDTSRARKDLGFFPKRTAHDYMVNVR